MRPAMGLTLIMLAIALSWVAMHGHDMSSGGFRGAVEALFGGIHHATAE